MLWIDGVFLLHVNSRKRLTYRSFSIIAYWKTVTCHWLLTWRSAALNMGFSLSSTGHRGTPGHPFGAWAPSIWSLSSVPWFHTLRRAKWHEMTFKTHRVKNLTFPETNIFAPKNGWLEYYFPIGEAYFQGRTVSFREGNIPKSTQIDVVPLKTNGPTAWTC